MKKKELTPKRRFKEFINDDAWEHRKVKDICEISTGKSNTQDRIADGIYPFYVRSSTIERSNRYLYDEEAVLTVGDGVGTGKVYHYVNGKYDLHQRVYRMFDFKNGALTKYFYHYFANHFYERVMAMTAKTSVDSVRYDMIAEMDIKMPSEKEQTKIIEFFNNLDNLITLHQRKLKKLKETKSAYLSEMFPRGGEKYPKLRFDGFTEPWEERKLNTFTEYQSSSYSSNQFTDIEPTGDYPVFDANNQIACLNKYDQESEYISIIKDGAGVGRVNLRPGKSSIIGTMGYILAKESDLSFIFNILQNINFNQFISGSTIPHIYYKDYGNAEFLIPTIKEQVQIGEFFQKLDKLITLHQRKLEKLENLKKAYLNEMFV